MVLRQCLKDGTDTLGETHVEHLVRLVKHDVANGVEVRLAALHEVDETARCGHDNLCAVVQGLYLVADTGTSVDSHDVELWYVLGEVAQVVGYLQAQLAGWREDDGLCLFALRVHHLQERQSERRRLSRTRLGKGYDVLLFFLDIFFTWSLRHHAGDFRFFTLRCKKRYYGFLHRHGIFESQFFDGAADFLRHAQFLKC